MMVLLLLMMMMVVMMTPVLAEVESLQLRQLQDNVRDVSEEVIHEIELCQ